MSKISCLLADDHSEIDDLISEALAALDSEDVELSYKKLDLFWARLAMHIRAEHLHLFPAIRGAFEPKKQTKERCAPSFEIAQSIIAKLHDDHDFFMRELISVIKQIRVLCENKEKLSNGLFRVRKTISAVSHRLKAHNELEESEVYRWVDTLLSPSERAALNERMQKEIDNLPPRFGKSEEVF
ncbi:MAG TPA: hemerythrin domain-containing protein [Pyrinomonadaceae bacterium]|nr:hemerythrin domain-containing protein [Pyrinomonadaceae bacterium]